MADSFTPPPSKKLVSDHLIEVLTPKNGLIIVWVSLLIISCFVWAFVGQIPVTVSGLGIILSSSEISTVSTMTNATVSDIKIESGELVEKGQVLMRLLDPSRKVQRIKLSQALARYSSLSQSIPLLEKELDYKQSMLTKSNEQESLIEKCQLSLNHQILTLEKVKTDIQDYVVQLSEAYHTEYAKHQYLQDTEDSFYVSLKKAQLLIADPFITIISPGNVRITSVEQKKGAFVQPGDTLFRFERSDSLGSPLEIYAYFPIDKGDRIAPGMRVTLDVASIDTTRWGRLIGRVSKTGNYPSSKKDIDRLVPNQDIAGYLMNNQPAVLQTLIYPTTNTENSNGYAWTSGSGPPQELAAGTVVQAQITIEQRKPIYYILPIWRDFTESLSHYNLIEK